MTNNVIKCHICGRTCVGFRGLTQHIRIHNISHEEYYDKYLSLSEDKTCLYCSEKRKFKSLNVGYYQTCCGQSCKDKKRKETNKKIFGNTVPMRLEIFKNKYKQTMLKNHGVEYSFLSATISKKIENIMIDRYGVKYALQNKEIHNKGDELKKIKYDNNSEKINKKRRQTCLEKLGVDCPLKSKELREKGKQTNLGRHGDRNYNNSEKRRQTNLKKLGVDCPLKSEKCKEKAKQTNLENYGVEHYTQTEEYRKMWKCDEYKKEVFKKRKQTKLEKYDDEYYNNSQKRYQTMKKNGTFNSSKKEIQLLKILKQTYPDIIHQYRSEAYPFNCDFYIPSKKLYIELNLHWTHSLGAFSVFNFKHLKKLLTWKIKSKTSAFYKNAIEMWTKRDTRKRRIAFNNNLNYVEFFKYDTDKILNEICKISH